MRYNFKNGIVKSENAAKSHLQKSSYLVKLLRKEPQHKNVLDFGCGKLRYFKELNKIAAHLHFHDSDVQLDRVQKIRGKQTTICSFASANGCSTIRKDEIKTHRSKFDFILCSNVISAIPTRDARITLVSDIKSLLKPGGKCLFVTQYNDAYFDTYKKRKNAIKKHDGWLYPQAGSLFFYGIVTPKRLNKLLTDGKLKIQEQIIHEGSVYAYASK